MDGNVLTVKRPIAAGDYVRWAGSVPAGVPIIRSGERLDAERAALLATAWPASTGYWRSRVRASY